MRNILVTGGAGYIGSHTAKLLDRMGYRPIIFDNLSVGHAWAALDHSLVVGDLRDGRLLRETLKTYRVDGVLHFAASAYVGESMNDPGKYFRNNVGSTIALLDAMVDTGVDKLVISSTCATYGTPACLPIGETAALNPMNPYGETKLMAERTVRWYGQVHGIKWLALRYFNAAGADPEGELGECHDPETHLIPVLLEAAMGLRERVKVFGTDYQTPDGTAIRDFIHVMDLAEAHVLALQYLADGGAEGAFNLGTGRGHSVQEVLRMIEAVTGFRVRVEAAERRRGDPPVLVADAQKAQSTLGWRPKFLDIGEIVQTAWEWHSNRASLAAVATV